MSVIRGGIEAFGLSGSETGFKLWPYTGYLAIVVAGVVATRIIIGRQEASMEELPHEHADVDRLLRELAQQPVPEIDIDAAWVEQCRRLGITNDYDQGGVTPTPTPYEELS